MLGLLIAIILFNTVAFFNIKRLPKRHMLHMWLCTMYFHLIVDFIMSYKYEGYWYFNPEIEWLDLPPLMLLSPPAILLFLDKYPFNATRLKRIVYILIWSLIIVIYEALSLLPEPWGFFHYGWWNLFYSALVYPFLFAILLAYYKWIVRLENDERLRGNKHEEF